MFWMTIDQIECFHAVVECGSFTKASTELHKAKSAVMYTIKKLEEQLGFELFDRAHYRPQVTEKGKAFLLRSSSVLAEMKALHISTQPDKTHLKHMSL